MKYLGCFLVIWGIPSVMLLSFISLAVYGLLPGKFEPQVVSNIFFQARLLIAVWFVFVGYHIIKLIISDTKDKE